MHATQRRPDSWIEQAPYSRSASREIAASPADIWEVLADHEAWPEWFPAVQEVTVTGTASGVGGRRQVRLRGLEIDEELVAWDVGERFAFRAIALSRPIFDSINERVTIEDLGNDRSLVTYTQAFAPKWWFALPFKAVQGQFHRAVSDALENLGARVE